jgi:PAS domain S-box-containing protein
MKPEKPPATLSFLSGGGEMGALMRGHDWAASPLGPPETWPSPLRSAVSIMLGSSFPTAIYWGPDLRLLYNDAWAPIPAERHPWALGRPAAEVWSDIWDVVSPQFTRVLETGEGFSTYDQMLPMLRGGVRRETYWNYSFTALRGEDGSVFGVFNQGNETTDRVLGGRRSRFLLDLGDRLRSLSDPQAIIGTAQEELGRFLHANRVGYGEVDDAARHFTTESNWTDGSVPSREGTHDLAGFGPEVLAALRAGVPLVISDAAGDPRTNAPESLAAFDAIDTRAVITASLVKEGRMRAALYVHAREPRPWTPDDAELVVEVAERTWSAVERARAESALRESEARLRGVLDGMGESLAILDRDFRIVDMNAEALRLERRPRGEVIGKTHWEAHPNADPALGEMFKRAMADTTPVSLKHRYVWPHGQTTWISMRAFPVADGLAVFYGDISEQVIAEERLRESEERLRLMADAVPQIVWITDAEGRHEFFNRQWSLYTGASPDGSDVARIAAEFVHPDDQEATLRAFENARREGCVFEVEHRIRSKDGDYRWFLVRAEPYRDPTTSEIVRWFGVSFDIHERRVAEEHRELLINELNHRVKNTLATVQSVASQTLRNADSASQAKEALEARLFALSRVHDVLTRENWDGANLYDIVEQAVAPYSSRGEDRLHLTGARVRVPPRMALALAMAMQELATNAVKYGALSTGAGHIRIAWDVQPTGSGSRLHFRWEESGGPPVRPPARRGFGSRLIERSLTHDLGGEARLEFTPTGIICTLVAPIS